MRRMTAAKSGDRKPNGRKAASVSASPTAAHTQPKRAERGRTGKRANLDNRITTGRKRHSNQRLRETTQRTVPAGRGGMLKH